MKTYEVHFFNTSGQCVEVRRFQAVDADDLLRQYEEYQQQSPLEIVGGDCYPVTDESDIL